MKSDRGVYYRAEAEMKRIDRELTGKYVERFTRLKELRDYIKRAEALERQGEKLGLKDAAS